MLVRSGRWIYAETTDGNKTITARGKTAEEAEANLNMKLAGGEDE